MPLVINALAADTQTQTDRQRDKQTDTHTHNTHTYVYRHTNQSNFKKPGTLGQRQCLV